MTLDWQLSSPVRQRAQLRLSPSYVVRFCQVIEEIVGRRQNYEIARPDCECSDMSRSILSLNVAEESRNDKPSLAEIREPSVEIHIERGGIHGCDLETAAGGTDLQEK